MGDKVNRSKTGRYRDVACLGNEKHRARNPKKGVVALKIKLPRDDDVRDQVDWHAVGRATVLRERNTVV